MREGLTVTLGDGGTVLLCWVLQDCSAFAGGCAWEQRFNIDFIGKMMCLKCGLRITLP